MYVAGNYDIQVIFMSSATPQTWPVPTTTVQEMEEVLTVVMILLYMQIVSANADHSFDSA